MAMTASERRARGAFYSAVCTMRSGDRILRALATELLDLSAVATLSDEQLIALPGVGEKNVRHLRTLLRMAIEEQNK